MKTIIELTTDEQKALDMLTYSETAEKLNIKEQRKINSWVMNNLLNLYHEVISELKEKCYAFKINSGYRCERTNDAVGGTKRSQHISGCAADLTCSDLDKMWNILRTYDVDQCIRYDTFIHVSYVSYRKNRNQYINYTTKE